MLGNRVALTAWRCTGSFRSVPSILLSAIALAVILSASSFAAEVVTDSTVYDLGSTVGIDGFTFNSGETVILQVTELDGTPITGDAGLPWNVASDGTGEFGTSWLLDYLGTSDELLVTAVGQSSGLTAITSFVAGATNLDQLQNGTETTPPEWSNGNINSSNSCYSEGRAVPYRAFINAELGVDSTHYFTIEMEWTKGSIHAFDFLASYDFSEDSAINLAGGPCGDVGTSAPEDCVEPTDSLVLPSPIDSFNYSGSIPSDFFTLVNDSFLYETPHYLMTYNAVIDSVEKYVFGGSSSDRTWSVVVHYTQVDTGTVGFYWGGHMAEGDPDHWGYGNGSASVSGAPYHMRMKSFDGGGGAGQDRSIQNGTICLPPVATILIDTDSLCYDFDTTYIAYDTSDANDWLWRVTGGTIIGDSTLSSVEFSVDSGATDVTIELVACNTDGGCPGDYCCVDVSVTLPTKSCNHPPEVYCPPDDSLFVCDLSEICVTGFTSYDADGDALNCEVSVGNLDGDSVCFTPIEGSNTITYICTDPWGAADTCETMIYVTLNSGPTASCPASDTLFVCDLSDICLDGFGCDDPDGNVVSSTINGVPFGGGQYCFTPIEGDNYLQLVCVDSCGEADTCQTLIRVELNQGPTASCPASDTLFVCDLSDICIGGFTTSDPDNNIATVTATGGTLSGDTVCFTPSVGSNTITLIVTDDCGEADTCQTAITVGLNSPPVASCPGDIDTTFVCDLSDICIDGFTASDLDGNIASVVVTGGTLSGDTVCFTPSVGANTITLIVTDSCGESDTCQTTATVTLNSAPVASCPGDDSLFVCDLSDICIDGFTTSDLDGNIASVVVTGGTLSGDTVCFTPSVGSNTITLIVTDDCGEADTCQTVITVGLNSPPVADAGPDQSLFLAEPTEICWPASCSDVDGNLTGCALVEGPGIYDDTNICFTPDTPGVYVFVLEATDDCAAGRATGYTDSDTAVITVTYNGPPVTTCPGDTSIFLCDLSEICVSGFGCDDPDDNVVSSTINGVPFGGGQYCFTPVEGDNYLQLICVDSCGEADTCETLIHIDLNQGPTASCPASDTLFVCDLSDICLDGFGCDDPDDNVVSSTINGVPFGGGQYCFTPVEGDNYLELICVDSCGEADTCETLIRVDLNQGPTASCPASDTLFVCDLSDICLDGFGCDDPDGNVVSSTINGVLFGGGQYCFTPVEGDNYLTLICVDSCGAADSCQTLIHVDLNQGPTASCPPSDTLFVCALDDICLDGFGCDDPDDNVVSSTINGVPFGGGQYCFTPVEGDNYLELICVDSCGEADTCQTLIHIDLNQGPTASCPASDTLFVCDLSDICLDGFGCDGNVVSSTINGVPFGGGQYCFTPVEGNNYLTLICVDSCGLADTCQTMIHVDLNQGPTASCPPSDTLFVCALDDICLDGFGCDGNVVSSTINGVPFGGGQYCFTPVEGDNYLQLICVDSCGAADSCQTLIHVDLNQGPTASCPASDTLFVCDLSDICLDGFGCDDPDGNVVSSTINGVLFGGGQYCFTPVEGDNYLTLICVDSCGAADSCQTLIHVDLNQGPTASCPPSDTLFVCALDDICLDGFGCDDPDDNVVSSTINGVPFGGGQYCFTPVEGDNYLELICVDSCGEADTCETLINVELNSPPAVTCPDDIAIITCYIYDPVCVDNFGATDVDGNLASITINGQPFTPGTPYCFVPDSGINQLIFVATDSCDAATACTTIVDVEADDPETCNNCPIVTIEKTHDTHQGQHELVTVTIDSAEVLLGGFEFLIAYDASALALLEVIPGPPFFDPAPDGCGWEYFAYRFGPFGNCGSGCPSGMVRVVGIAEINNGPNHADCWLPSPQPATVFTLDFLVTDDRTFECQYVPIYFYWTDCTDNTMSDSTGNILYIDQAIYDFEGNLIWDEDDDDLFPEDARPTGVGAPDYCLNPDPDKPTAIRCLDFYNGGIDIVCADSIDDRGDVNLNGAPNEIADAVLFINYFVEGLSVFTVNPAGQIAASDVNADGITLSVADLVYLIRIVVGDALPYAKLAPIVVKADLTDGVLSVGVPLGAAWVALQGEHRPELLAPGLEMKYRYDADADLTRILVYSLQKDRTFEGAFLAGLGSDLVAFEAATYQGVSVAARLIPNQFALYQCYPNPFNPVTTISFSLAEAADYELTIFNTLGRQVQSFTGHAQPGVVEIQWNASGHASGIYFYRLTAGDFTDTKKMVLLK